jgi:hypothetical protein
MSERKKTTLTQLVLSWSVCVIILSRSISERRRKHKLESIASHLMNSDPRPSKKTEPPLAYS